MVISLQNVACGYDRSIVLNNINLTFRTGEFCCILGSNGIGKTTFFKTLLGFMACKTGRITIDDKDIVTMQNKEIARYISYVPQAKKSSYHYSVIDIVLMGRARYIKQFEPPSKEDYKVAKSVLDSLGILYLENCLYSELSGGEQQIVLIARALAQESKFIVMDEPASNLDFENQKRVLDVLKYLSSQDRGIIMSSHSPDHAFYCGTNIVLINRDKTIIYGLTDEVLTTSNLKKVYGVDVSIITGKNANGEIIKSCCLS